MRTIVTGGAGFIGSHLVEHLLAEDHEVIVLDNFSTGRMENLEHLTGSTALKVIEVDITDHASIKSYFREIDWVFHLAALADIVPSIQKPLEYHHANVTGTLSVLEASRKGNVSRFIYSASSSCYGIPDIYPTPEAATIQPQYPYALTKYLGEQAVIHWHQVFDLPAVSLRFFNVYGPRSRTSGTYGAVFGIFLAQKLAGEPFTVVGDGTQTRDFTYVTDIVNACLVAAQSDIEGEILNVGSGGSSSVNQLVELLGGEVTFIPKRPGEPDCTLADISKIRSLLGWEPHVPFDEGVQIMLENIDYWREAPVWTPATIEEATEEWFENLGRGLDVDKGR
jgi:UDP-glucose 4-epimerase